MKLMLFYFTDVVSEKINKQDYQHDYSSELLMLNSKLGNWSEILRISTDLLIKDPDNWLAWKALLQHSFENEER